MQTSLKIMNRAIWNFQLLPLSIFHTFYIGGSSPLTVLKYPKMTMSFLNLLEILEIKMQEAWRTKPINNIYRYCLSLLSNKEMYNAEVLVLMSSEKLHRKKKLPGSDSKAFALNSACEWEFFPPVSLKQNRTEQQRKLQKQIQCPHTDSPSQKQCGGLYTPLWMNEDIRASKRTSPLR